MRKAIAQFEQAVELARLAKAQDQQALSLLLLGRIYSALGEKQKALDYYNQALPLRRAVGDRDGEAVTLNNIGVLFALQKQPELAIVFYKQSVSVFESLRKDIRQLPKDTQKAYAESIASAYRGLADILLKQDRILEAQQVLDLLKVQELEDYLRNTRSSNTPELTILKPEAEILKRYGELQASAIKLGDRLAQLRQLNSKNALTPAQTQELAQLTQLETDLNRQFNQFVDSAPGQGSDSSHPYYWAPFILLGNGL